MDSIIRNVTDIDQADRQALEHVVGRQLHENQQVVINVRNVDAPTPAADASATDEVAVNSLPEWCNVYEGLSDEEVDEIEKSIVRCPDNRCFD